MITVLLVAAAWAAEPPPVGHIVLATSPEARVEILPRIDPLRIDVGIYENERPLAEQIRGRSARYVTDTSVVSIGGGTSFLTLYVERPEIDVSWAFEDQGLVLSVAPGTPVVLPEEPLADVDTLLARDLPRRLGPPPAPALTMLSGDASTLKLEASHFDLDVPRIDIPSGMTARLSASDAPTLGTIDRYRAVLAEAISSEERAAAQVRLGDAHHRLGLPREAAYYLRAAGESDPSLPVAPLRLWQARTAIALQRWDEALRLCREAHEAGAEDEVVLACVGVVSLATASPPPGPTGRALVAVTEVPRLRLLGAELLLADRRYERARDVLAPLAADSSFKLRDLAAANLGDALFALGDIEAAHKTWEQAAVTPELTPLLQHRQRIVDMLAEGPSSWAAQVPRLEVAGRGLDAAGAEAHWLLAQIGEVYDDQELAAVHLAALVDHHLGALGATDVPARLIAVCNRRLDQLQRRGLIAEQAAFYLDCWRPTLESEVVDVRPLERVSMAFDTLGLTEQALEVQLTVLAIRAREETDDPEALARLADLYARVGRNDEALQTIAYTRQRPNAAPVAGRLALIEADALERRGDRDAAEQAWRRAWRWPEARDAASLRLGLMLARTDRCAAALPKLERWAASEELPEEARTHAEIVHVALLRCRGGVRGPAAVLDGLERALAVSDTPSYRQELAWIATFAARLDGRERLPEELTVPAQLAPLFEEEAASEAFAVEVDARRGN